VAFVLGAIAGRPALASLKPAPDARFDGSSILIELKPGRHFLPGAGARSGSPSLDERLDRAAALDAAPLFAPDRGRSPARAALGLDRVYRVRLRRPTDVPSLASELSRHPDVEWAEPDYEGSAAGMPAATQVVPNDPSFDHQWPLRNTGFVPGLGASTAGADIRATDAWSITTGDSGVVVAVLDTGLRYDYPDFRGRVWSNAGEIAGNGMDDDGNGFIDDVRGYNFAYSTPEVLDDGGHGTAVAGVIGVTSNDGLGYCGLDWACRIMPVKILSAQGFGNYSWWASAIVYAVDNGARILNMSVVGLQPSMVLQTAVRYAYAHDCLIVAAAGNSGEATPYVPASYDAEVLAVGATDRNDHRAGFSTYGSFIDVVAPGQDIAVLTLGVETYTSYGSGTSFASPLTAGLAALLLAKDPTLGAAALRDIICATADDGVGTSADDTPGWDRYYGYGRINALRALTFDRIPHSPTVTAPAFLNPVEGTAVVIPVTASDVDGDPIVRLEADLAALPPGNGASFAVNATHTAGTLTWTPSYADAGGPYNVTFRAFDPLRGQATTTMFVVNVNRSPSVSPPAAASFVETEPGSFEVGGTDPDGEELGLSASDLPPGAAFEDHGNNTGTFSWTPGVGQAGTYTVAFEAQDGSLAVARAATAIEVARRNRAPVADASGPYAGVAGAPVAFDGSASDDPDGDPLRYRWSFGDGIEGTGPTPEHVYEHGGDFTVVLDVSDGSLSALDSTGTRITDALAARAFLLDGRRTVSLSEGTAPVRIGLEPAAGSYSNGDVNLASLRFVVEGRSSGSVAPDLRSITEADHDRNGVPELSLGFDRRALRGLLGSTAPRDSIDGAVEGRLANGARIRGGITLVVTGGRSAGAPILVSSNPIEAGGVLTVRNGSTGRWRVRLFDARGRLVRTLLDEAAASPGAREVPFDATDDHGGRIASGIYFIRSETPAGSATSRVAVLR